MAEAFAAEGHDLFLTARNEVKLYGALESLMSRFPDQVIKANPFDLGTKNGPGDFGNWVLGLGIEPDILINNAAQTVRRTPGAYAQLIAAESAPPPQGPLPVLLDLGYSVGTAPAAIGGHFPTHALTPHALTALALTSGSASLDRVAEQTAIDAGGLVPDLDAVNSWTRRVHEVDPVELLEVQLCNMIAPFILVSRLRPSLAAAAAWRKYVVNVSAMEGQFGRIYKGAGHPHTNMAKAAVNMLTRTSARDLFAERILMTSVDTGWITDERPHPTKARLAGEGFHAPLDLIDGAARVYDPIVRGEQGEDLYDCFLKDYAKSAW